LQCGNGTPNDAVKPLDTRLGGTLSGFLHSLVGHFPRHGLASLGVATLMFATTVTRQLEAILLSVDSHMLMAKSQRDVVIKISRTVHGTEPSFRLLRTLFVQRASLVFTRARLTSDTHGARTFPVAGAGLRSVPFAFIIVLTSDTHGARTLPVDGAVLRLFSQPILIIFIIIVMLIDSVTS
jgi:hypothetical protein